MSSKPVPFTATVLLTAASSLFLSGCGGDTATTTPVPAPPAPPSHSTAPPDDDDTPTSTTPHQSKCCYSRWGGVLDCGNYPEGGHMGICNNDGNTTCSGDSECSDIVPPSTTAPATTTPYRRPTTTTTTLPDGACRHTSWSGCLNGASYVMAERFTCGKGTDIGIYKWGETSCCALGRLYDPHEKFCCNNELNLHSDGQCREYDSSDDPVGCRCDSASTSATETMEADVSAATDTVIIDTIDYATQPENPCLMAEGYNGCLNGFLFDYNADTICGQYIVKGDTHGCCPRVDGIHPYNLATESCCQYGDSATIRAGAHMCQCRAWPKADCPPALMFTVV